MHLHGTGRRRKIVGWAALAALSLGGAVLVAQDAPPPPPQQAPPREQSPQQAPPREQQPGQPRDAARAGPGGFGIAGPGGPGGPGPQQERKIVKQFDQDNNGWLNKEERAAARAFIQKERANSPQGRRGFGGGGGGWFGPGGGGGFGGGGVGSGGGFGGGGQNPPATRPTTAPGNFGPGGGGQAFGGGFGGPGGPSGGGPGGGRFREPAKPGPRVSPDQVKAYPDSNLYEPTVLRTFFLEFENADWEAELADFRQTDVDVPATLTVDGKKYPNVGVHFRGMSSYMMIPAGYKRSFNITMDLADKKQRLYGHKSLNLLNSNGDPSFLHGVLASHIIRQFIPAPRVNHVKVVVNGESWGLYANAQQFNKDFTKEWFDSEKGARWKVPGSPRGGGGLTYLGEDVEQYKRRYEIKSKDDEKSWRRLIELCRVLNQTPVEELDKALKPLLDIDKALWFLALDVSLVNEDGYWIRDSDYGLYLDEKGKFHLVPHDMNETFHAGGGPGGGGRRGGPPGGAAAVASNQVQGGGQGQGRLGGPDGQRPGGPDGPQRGPDGGQRASDRGPGGGGIGGGGQGPGGPDGAQRGPGGGFGGGGFGGGGGQRGPGGGGFGGGGFGGPGGGGMGGRVIGVNTDPMVSMDDQAKPLRSKLLRNPKLRQRYLEHVRTIARDWLDYQKLEPLIEQYRQQIEKEVESDTRKLSPFEAFKAQFAKDKAPAAATGPATAPARGGEMSLKSFIEQRRNYLLNHPEIKKLEQQ
jgi:spore coat protein CotH